jgi:hypothetical protein
MTEEPFPSDGSLYDLGLDDGKLYQTEDGFTFHPVGKSSILQTSCSIDDGLCGTKLKAPKTTTSRSQVQRGISEKRDIFSFFLVRRIVK